MKIVTNLEEWRAIRAALDGDRAPEVGFVPTMGALHAGHASLFERSRKENRITAGSILVNPTQFNDPSDYEKYPKTWDKDVALLEKLGVDYLLAPLMDAMYPDRYRYFVDERELSKVLCGAHRPGHFQGVLTVVMKLLNLVRPDRAYFGEKDYQQLQLISGMARAFFMGCEIVPCPIVREADGLAMSSRNARLSADHRERAPAFYRALSSGKSVEWIRETLETEGFEVEYLEDRDGRRFGAVWLGGIRLIDNVSMGEARSG